MIALVCDGNWRLMIGIAAGPALIQLIWMFFLPESQRFLSRNQNDEKCLEVLKMVYEDDDADKELIILQEEI